MTTTRGEREKKSGKVEKKETFSKKLIENMSFFQVAKSCVWIHLRGGIFKMKWQMEKQC
jgi:hypothetical protein